MIVVDQFSCKIFSRLLYRKLLVSFTYNFLIFYTQIIQMTIQPVFYLIFDGAGPPEGLYTTRHYNGTNGPEPYF